MTGDRRESSAELPRKPFLVIKPNKGHIHRGVWFNVNNLDSTERKRIELYALTELRTYRAEHGGEQPKVIYARYQGKDSEPVVGYVNDQTR